MSTTKQHRRRAAADPNAPSPSTASPSLLTATLHNGGVSKAGKPLSPLPPSTASAARYSRAVKTPGGGSGINTFWGEEEAAQAARSGSADKKPQWVEDEERANIKDWYSKQNTAAGFGSEMSLKKRDIVFETQQIMPAPGTTYFQLVVESDRVLLRDWPRQRYSQKWTRNGGLNPGQKIISLESFIAGEKDEELVHIFGQDVYDKAVNAAEKTLR
ncbi:hypothetical protein BC830DRAFT_1115279 [Chytriomyces sp. MP71]|nr:hypothetical protein BC830DRAFT_1115279 [Chytriomyces sp. MP71]